MRILITGGTGTFGRSVVPLLAKKQHEVWAPSRNDLDVSKKDFWHRAVAIFQPDLIVHAAAYTGVDRAEKNRDDCYLVNVEGTRLGLSEARDAGIRFVFISTDYVFDGERGNYGVSDRLGPVNYYAFTKVAGELLVTAYEKGAAIRTSFAPDGPWRYPKAWTDLWTGKDYISVLAPEYAAAILTPFMGVVHIATERKTLYDLAKRFRPDVTPGLRSDASMPLPRDVSLDISSWEFVKKCWRRIYRSHS